ncbi:hypothetical protein [Alicyclobacillus acidiphilus]|uniref:hypothetical protein n=1 Tax=Alicyclobacillus acidiphilus TaxID=182455 RepID=UPI00082DE5EA|nr:hypothetical protein [Alicyclobacillus acidiphilus]
MRKKLLATVATTILLSSATPSVVLAANQTSSQTSSQDVITKHFTFDQPLTIVPSLTYGSETTTTAQKLSAQALSAVVGADIANVEPTQSKIHFDVTTTTQKSDGSTVIQAQGYVGVGQEQYKISTTANPLYSISTSLGILEKAEIPGTLTTPSGKSYSINIGIAYIPNTDNYQATVVVDGLGYPLSLDFGKGFITQSLAQQIETASPSSVAEAPLTTTTSTSTSTSNSTTSAVYGTGTAESATSSNLSTDDASGGGTHHFLGDDYTTVLDGDSNYFGNNTPTAVLRGSNGPEGTGELWVEDQVWGTNQVENYLSGTGRAISVSGVNFAVQNPNNNWLIDNQFYPVPQPSTSISLSPLSWAIDYIPELAPYSALVNALANQSVTVGGGIQEETPTTDPYFQQINWSNVQNDELTGSYDPPSGKESYNERFFVNAPNGAAITIDGQVIYETDAYAIGFTTYDSSGWIYMPGTIGAPS